MSWCVPFEVVLDATAFSLMSLRSDEPLVATMVSTLFFFSAAELAWDWVSMAFVHSSTPHGDGVAVGGGQIERWINDDIEQDKLVLCFKEAEFDLWFHFNLN